jgi:hypothetical protein
MPAPTGTFSRYTAIGVREDLADVIYNISPQDTPFMSNAGRDTADNTLFEWQVDELAAATAASAVVEGNDVTGSTSAPTTRLANYTQINSKDVVISGTAERVKKAGRKSELAYQLAKRGKELKRDMELSMLQNQIAVAGDTASTPRRSAGLPAFLVTNANRGAGGAGGSLSGGLVTTGATDGTQRAFTEVILKDVIQKVWTEGGTPRMLMVGPVNKVRASGFAGIAEIRFDLTAPKQATIIGAADVYVSDFGKISIVANRFQRERDAFVLDPEYFSISWLRPIFQHALAKTGDSEKRQILGEWGLKISQQKALGVAADLTVV